MEQLTFYDIDQILTTIADRKSSNFDLDTLLDSDITNLDKLKGEVNDSFHDQLDLLGDFQVVSTDDSDRDGYDTEQIWRVLYFKNHDVYVKVKGWWSSHGGSEYSDMFEVRPEQVTVTQYKKA